MKDTYTIIARVVSTHRLESSRNGNPRYRVALQPHRTDGREAEVIYADTRPDAPLGYAITNTKYMRDLHEWQIGMHYGRLSIGQVRLCPERRLRAESEELDG